MTDYHSSRWTIVLDDDRPFAGISFDSIDAAWSFIHVARLSGAKPVPPADGR